MIEELVARVQRQYESSGWQSAWWNSEAMSARFHSFQLRRSSWEREVSKMSSRLGSSPGPRVAATACWNFPIYSQTFVYQELSHLAGKGFPLQFLYSSLNSRDQLPPQHAILWNGKRKICSSPAVWAADQQYYEERMPERVTALLGRISAATRISTEDLRRHRHYAQAFTFTRMVEAWGPDYLHSYFFYEGTLFALFASHLLGIPRGVSCYADHMLQDYDLKLVPLHMDQCSIVVATSERIKRELLGLAPDMDPAKILVKPNAIDPSRFPVEENRAEPAAGEPFRLTCVSRIEPKKGIVYFVEALKLLRDRGVTVEAHILGDVDRNEVCQRYAESVRERILELGLPAVFHLEGRKSPIEIREYLRRSQLFVAPFVETESGDKDGIPTALLEGMSTGLPAVATDSGSITEVVTDGEDGVLVPQRDPAALAGAIESLLLGDRSRRTAMGLEAASMVRKKFDVSRCEEMFHRRVRSAAALASRSK